MHRGRKFGEWRGRKGAVVLGASGRRSRAFHPGGGGAGGAMAVKYVYRLAMHDGSFSQSICCAAWALAALSSARGVFWAPIC
eukprot:1069559-Pyramimonas_sp.AAC.1